MDQLLQLARDSGYDDLSSLDFVPQEEPNAEITRGELSSRTRSLEASPRLLHDISRAISPRAAFPSRARGTTWDLSSISMSFRRGGSLHRDLGAEGTE